MGRKKWQAYITPSLRLDASIEYDKGSPTDYSFQLCGVDEGDWVELVRYDNAHGTPHRHISYPDGPEESKTFVAALPITFVGWAQDDLIEHAEKYYNEWHRRKSNMKRGRR